MVNDFSPFGSAMAKLSVNAKTIERMDGSKIDLASAVHKGRTIDTSYEIYCGLYQAITGPEERQKIFKELSPGFFDLIVIDECHRGSAADDAAWREILEYFSSATQIGMTATPRETKYVSNMNYFGPPVWLMASARESRMAFSRHTRSSKFISTGMCRATVPRPARWTAMAKRLRIESITERTSNVIW